MKTANMIIKGMSGQKKEVLSGHLKNFAFYFQQNGV